MSLFLYLLFLIPIGASLAILAGAPARITAMASSAINVVVCAVLYLAFDSTAGLQFQSGITLLEEPHLALSVGIDGMSLILLVLATLVTLCAVWVSPAKPGGSVKIYYVSTLLIAAGAIGAFVSTDLFFFYAFHELALIPTFLMIAMWGYGHERRATAWKITIYLALGSIVLLAGLIALFANITTDVATFNIAELTEAAKAGNIADPDVQKWIALTLLVGFGVLVSLFPFHSWAAPAYATAPTPVAMLHAGVLKKFGLYGLLRVAMPMLPEGFNTPLGWCFGELTVTGLMLLLLLGNILFIGLVTISQERLDRMLGFSSVMHMGYAFLGIACYNAVGWTGAVMMMFAHGISIALLFALCGNLRSRVPSLDFDTMGGLGKSAPMFALLFGFAAFASIGLPGFANFASELLIFLGAFQGADGKFGALQITTIFALWGVVISAVYMLRGYRKTFQGEAGETESIDDLAVNDRWPIIILIVALLLIGFFPSLFVNLIEPTFTAFFGSN